MTQSDSSLIDLPREERLAVFGIDGRVVEIVQGFAATIRADLPQLFELFERKLEASPALRLTIGHNVPALREVETAHLLTLFEARFDETYLASA